MASRPGTQDALRLTPEAVRQHVPWSAWMAFKRSPRRFAFFGGLARRAGVGPHGRTPGADVAGCGGAARRRLDLVRVNSAVGGLVVRVRGGHAGDDGSGLFGGHLVVLAGFVGVADAGGSGGSCGLDVGDGVAMTAQSDGVMLSELAAWSTR